MEITVKERKQKVPPVLERLPAVDHAGWQAIPGILKFALSLFTGLVLSIWPTVIKTVLIFVTLDVDGSPCRSCRCF